MFGPPIQASSDKSVFLLVWTYNVKAADGRKKACYVCNGSTRSGHVQVLDETYANCVNQTSARLFYAVAAGENMPKAGHFCPPRQSISRLVDNIQNLHTNTP